MERSAFEVEICANSIQSVIAAEAGGANRVELCDNLLEGGTTPSIGLVKVAKHLTNIPVYPIIRPRSGDFHYNSEELQIMLADILSVKKAGVDGIAIGCLTPEGSIDKVACAQLIKKADGLNVTFHRAFDMCADPVVALEDIIDLGCSRLLTSGHRNKALDGVRQIKELVDRANGRITIMAGSGVDQQNAPIIAKETGVRAFHASLREHVDGRMTFRKPGIAMGGLEQVAEYSNRFSNTKKIESLISNLLKASH